MSRTATPTRQGIDRTVDRYATGLRDGDVAILKEAFRPEALVSGYIEKELFVKPVQFLYDYVGQNESPAKRGDAFTHEIDAIQVSGDTAVVKLTEHKYLGYDYETSLQMVKIEDRWWIVSKLFSGTASA